MYNLSQIDPLVFEGLAYNLEMLKVEGNSHDFMLFKPIFFIVFGSFGFAVKKKITP